MLEKILVIRKIISYIAFIVIIILFVRLANGLGALQAPFLKPVMDMVYQVDEAIMAPVYVVKTFVMPRSPDKIFMKKGFVEPIVLISIAFYLLIRYIIEVILLRICRKLEAQERQKKIQARKKNIHYAEWND